MGVVSGCVKIIVFAFNLVFALAGIALISIGIIYKLNLGDFTNLIPSAYDKIELAPILTIIIGCVVFVIAFFGCCGAIKESICFLTIYAIILLLIFIAQIALGVFAFLEIKDENDFNINVNRTIEQVFNNYNKTSEATELVNLLQQELECCGVNGTKYWGDHVPNSCCEGNNCREGLLYTDGCQVEFAEFVRKIIKVIGITVLALSATEVIGAIMSLCLSNSLRNESRRNRY